MLTQDIITKYTVPVPRYTSYPTVPFWDESTFNKSLWLQKVKQSFDISNHKDGISVYIHLPYCESLCTYCACNKRITKNHGVEEPYLKAVIKEWKLYKAVFGAQPQLKEIHLGGGTPTFFSPENLALLIKGILEDCLIHEDAEFSFEAHPANTTLAHLEVLYALGFKRLSLGIQDFDEQVQIMINRIQSVEEVDVVSKQARAIGYTSVNFDLIYGLPLQTVASLTATVEKVIGLKPDRIAFYSYAHVPWVKSGQRKFTEADLPDTHLRQELYEKGREMLLAAGYLDIGMDHFAFAHDSLNIAAQNKKLHRNFMGYTHQYTRLLVGLGVSSISDTWDAFAQNVKSEEEYLALINAGELPVVKGHVLNNEDLLIRRHILNIMCKGVTTWSDDDLQNDAFRENLLGLPELVEDGLIIQEHKSIKVTKTGKRFLRNVCAVFDARLQATKLEKQLFSIG
jgi:oxygen-independent coproporphyrinogen-3 oxidase